MSEEWDRKSQKGQRQKSSGMAGSTPWDSEGFSNTKPTTRIQKPRARVAEGSRISARYALRVSLSQWQTSLNLFVSSLWQLRQHPLGASAHAKVVNATFTLLRARERVEDDSITFKS